jgi:uncharacterized protein YkwD
MRLNRPMMVLLLAAALGIAFGPSASAATNTAKNARAQAEAQFVKQLLLEINEFRVAHSVRPLRVGPALRRAAEQHNREMGRLGYFSHDSANGTDCAQRLERYYPPSRTRFWSVGENLLWSARDLTPLGALRVWLHSPPHRANLLRPDWRQIGLSALNLPSAPGYFGHRRIWLVTADFGVR